MYIIEKRANAGLTIVEFVVALGIGFMAMAGSAALSVYTARSFAAIGNYMELDKNSRNALDRMTQIIREADGVTEYNDHLVELAYRGGTISFTYSPGQKVLTMVNTNGARDDLLTDCTFFTFQVFQRNSVAGTYDQYPATVDLTAAKIVQVSWICSRRLIGNLLNTESVQSAKIVIRKQ